MRPTALMYIATRAANQAWKEFSHRQKHLIDPESANDAASAILEHYYSVSEYERPQTDKQFEIFALTIARQQRDQETNHNRKHYHAKWSPERGGLAGTGTQVDFASGNLDYIVQRAGSPLKRSVAPTQEWTTYAKQILFYISRLPDEDQQTILKLARAGDIIGFAEDNNISIFDALKGQRRLRAIVRRIAEDLGDERLFDLNC
jgi:hypothetical protein